MKILSPWPWPKGHPWSGDGADKNFRPISTIMPNMNEIHQRVFKIWGLINFNTKTLTLTFLWKFEVRDLDPKVTTGVGMVLIKTWPISINMQNMNEIHQRVFKIWGLINFNTKTLILTFFMKILSPWPWPQGHPRDGDGADKNFRPISTIMPNMNEIHQRVFKIWGLINFNAKTLTLWRKDEWWTNERTNERTNIRTNEQTDERKSENYIPPHTSYVGGIIRRVKLQF